MIKKYRFPLLIVFVAMLATQALHAQSNCYVRLEDASGYTPTAEQIGALEQAAAELCLAFDSSGFGGQFKVYDFGFYLHHEATEGGYPEPFARKVEEVAALSPYYLVFGKQSDRSGVYTRFWVEARLPDSLSFSCLDTIGAGILRTSLGLTANIEYEALGKMPSNFHLAEIRVMNKLKAEVDKLRECCYNQQRGLSSCDAPCLTPDETKKLLEQLGFTAIPIKILGPAQARGADGQRPVYNRVTDCAELDIEIDGVEYYDFAGTINNIMSVYQDSTVRAEILDEGCLCAGGIEYLKGKMGDESIVLIISLVKDPLSPGYDKKYIFQKYPKNLGTLPFRGHFPNKLGNQETLPLDMNYIKNTVNTIYQKNGFSLTSIDFEEPIALDTFDIYNEIRVEYAKGFNALGGHCNSIGRDLISDKFNFINYKITTINLKNKIQNIEHRNYIVGAHIAHEFMHQIVDKCYRMIIDSKPMIVDWSAKESHCTNKQNLMFPGDGGPYKGVYKTYPSYFTEEEKKAREDSDGYWETLYITGIMYPLKNDIVNTSQWEIIPNSYKAIISSGLIIYDIGKNYGYQSAEYCCASKIIKKIHSKFIFNEYELK